ncbi:MAG: GAF domain-containing protein [Syntrophales bacterium]|nr:GAF domain-containing protein [Syntrophales bacterium]MDY0044042.1 GAF domain-containing protein [Syntrophales bacterium]
MKLLKWLNTVSLANKNLYYQLTIIFSLFFLIPIFGFLYFAVKYDILKDTAVPFFFIFLLIFSLLGFVLLRGIFDRIISISRNITERFSVDTSSVSDKEDELRTIVNSVCTVENQLNETFGQLQRKISEMSVLKELSDLCYVTFDKDELLYIALERALKLANADIGSVMILEKPNRDSFIVKATIGLGTQVNVGDRMNFTGSIAKYAVINKSPLIIENIETDSRFGRSNRPQYGTKSFICMPIKTIRNIIGVLTLSRRNSDIPFTDHDVEAVTPLISNAAFTYENLRLIEERDLEARYSKILERLLGVINSSFRDSELVQAILNEIRQEISFSAALILVTEETQPGHLRLYDLYTSGQTELIVGGLYPYLHSIFEKIIRQGNTALIEDTEELSIPVEREILGGRGSGSALLVPLKIEGNAAGMLILKSDRPDDFKRMKSIIDHIAQGMSLAIERSTLLAAVAKRNIELDTLKQIGGALATSTFDMEQVVSYTMDMIRVIMNVEAGSLLLVKGRELEFSVAFEMDVKKLQGFRLKLGQGIAGYVAARGEAVIVNDVRKSTLFFPDVDRLINFKTRSVLCVPLISQGRVIGVLEVLNKTTGDFNTGDQQLLQSIASSVGIALENARLYKETVSMADNEREIRRMFQKFVPKEVVEKIIHGTESDRKLREEFKTVTLLNIDIRGFSGMAKSMGPQKTVAVLNFFFSVMGDIVFRHEGIVDKYLGDGFLALFGAIGSSASDADNAIAAALEMKKALTMLNDYFVSEAETELCVGISIHTGEVVIGNIGFDKKMDYTVIGDSVNAVFRLQNMTKTCPNSILISEMTRRATQSHLDLREIGQGDIDLTRGQLKIYEVLDIYENLIDIREKTEKSARM